MLLSVFTDYHPLQFWLGLEQIFRRNSQTFKRWFLLTVWFITAVNLLA